MRYINKSTNAVIETDCIISGGDWEAETKPSKRGKGGRKSKGDGADGDQLKSDEQDAEDTDELEE